MVEHFSQYLPPPDAVKILIVLAFSFLIGLEREEHEAKGDYSFGGVRTFPLIGLVGYAVALLSRDQLVPLSIGVCRDHGCTGEESFSSQGSTPVFWGDPRRLGNDVLACNSSCHAI
jgi:hypothetical protein